MENEKKSSINKYLWIVIILIILWGIIEIFNLNKKEEKSIINTNNNTASTSELINISASGNEPGWYLKINGDTSSANTLLVVDYGEATFTGILGRTWQENYESETQYRGFLTPSATSTIKEEKDFIIYFKKEICTDDADKAHTYKVEINMHSEKEYKGCADFN